MSGKEAGEHFGGGHPGGVSREYHMDKFKIEGCYLNDPTTGSTIKTTATAAHDFNVDISEGMIMLDGVKTFVPAAADVDISHSASASFLAIGESVYFTIVYYKDEAGNIEQRIMQGAIAATASAAPLTPAEIGAKFGESVPWMAIGHILYTCTDTTALTESQDNTIRSMGEPDIT